jgi:hypothetical protein
MPHLAPIGTSIIGKLAESKQILLEDRPPTAKAIAEQAEGGA